VGISIHGPAAIHDTSRRTATGRPTFERVLEGMSTLRDANVPFGVLMVVTETTLEYGADAVFDFFLQLGVRSYGFNAVKPVNVPHAGPATPIDHYLTPG